MYLVKRRIRMRLQDGSTKICYGVAASLSVTLACCRVVAFPTRRASCKMSACLETQVLDRTMSTLGSCGGMRVAGCCSCLWERFGTAMETMLSMMLFAARKSWTSGIHPGELE